MKVSLSLVFLVAQLSSISATLIGLNWFCNGKSTGCQPATNLLPDDTCWESCDQLISESISSKLSRRTLPGPFCDLLLADDGNYVNNTVFDCKACYDHSVQQNVNLNFDLSNKYNNTDDFHKTVEFHLFPLLTKCCESTPVPCTITETGPTMIKTVPGTTKTATLTVHESAVTLTPGVSTITRVVTPPGTTVTLTPGTRTTVSTIYQTMSSCVTVPATTTEIMICPTASSETVTLPPATTVETITVPATSVYTTTVTENSVTTLTQSSCAPSATAGNCLTTQTITVPAATTSICLDATTINCAATPSLCRSLTCTEATCRYTSAIPGEMSTCKTPSVVVGSSTISTTVVTGDCTPASATQPCVITSTVTIVATKQVTSTLPGSMVTTVTTRTESVPSTSINWATYPECMSTSTIKIPVTMTSTYVETSLSTVVSTLLSTVFSVSTPPPSTYSTVLTISETTTTTLPGTTIVSLSTLPPSTVTFVSTEISTSVSTEVSTSVSTSVATSVSTEVSTFTSATTATSMETKYITTTCTDSLCRVTVTQYLPTVTTTGVNFTTTKYYTSVSTLTESPSIITTTLSQTSTLPCLNGNHNCTAQTTVVTSGCTTESYPVTTLTSCATSSLVPSTVTIFGSTEIVVSCTKSPSCVITASHIVPCTECSQIAPCTECSQVAPCTECLSSRIKTPTSPSNHSSVPTLGTAPFISPASSGQPIIPTSGEGHPNPPPVGSGPSTTLFTTHTDIIVSTATISGKCTDLSCLASSLYGLTPGTKGTGTLCKSSNCNTAVPINSAILPSETGKIPSLETGSGLGDMPFPEINIPKGSSLSLPNTLFPSCSGLLCETQLQIPSGDFLPYPTFSSHHPKAANLAGVVTQPHRLSVIMAVLVNFFI